MKLRVAKKIVKAIGTDREDRYSKWQLNHAFDVTERMLENQRARAYWHALMGYLGPAGRAQVVASWSPAKALDLLMGTPEEDWEGDKSLLNKPN